MTPTLNFLSTNFHLFNEEYFGGELETPRFEICNTKTLLGQCCWKWKRDYFSGNLVCKDFTIRISRYFNRSESEIQNTILHEMIHLYIRQNNLTDPKSHHGKLFYDIADRINEQGGWNISRTDSVEGCGLNNNRGKIFYVACFKSKDRAFIFCINKNYLNCYYERFKRVKNWYKDAFIFTSTNHEKFAHLTECRKSVRGRFISLEDYYDYLTENANDIIFVNVEKSVAC